jgi:hypothetical protein
MEFETPGLQWLAVEVAMQFTVRFDREALKLPIIYVNIVGIHRVIEFPADTCYADAAIDPDRTEIQQPVVELREWRYFKSATRVAIATSNPPPA